MGDPAILIPQEARDRFVSEINNIRKGCQAPVMKAARIQHAINKLQLKYPDAFLEDVCSQSVESITQGQS
jgi:hypothetical protein